jgi:hypothetical protein
MACNKLDLVKLDQAAKYDRGLPHQKKAWEYLQSQLSNEVLVEFTKLFRPLEPKSQTIKSEAARTLVVPYESQHDNTSGTGYRECFSSSCGAVAHYYGRVSIDDEYNIVRSRYGDTTNPQAHILALEALGLKATFITNGTPDLLRNEILEGRPVVVGWIHKGPLSAPHGTGHYSVIKGFTEKNTIHSDPYGEADIVNGGYVNTTGGNGVGYSWANWRRRWEVVGSPSLWRYAPGNGWAMLIRK